MDSQGSGGEGVAKTKQPRAIKNGPKWAGETSKEIEMELKQKLLCLRLALGRIMGQRGDGGLHSKDCQYGGGRLSRGNEMCVNILIE